MTRNEARLKRLGIISIKIPDEIASHAFERIEPLIRNVMYEPQFISHLEKNIRELCLSCYQQGLMDAAQLSSMGKLPAEPPQAKEMVKNENSVP